MNQKLTEKLTKLPETLTAATDFDALTATIVETERLVLKSNYEERASETPVEEYEARDFVVGEANTRGLSWKLNLFRAVADATFCKMVRTGVHGGNVKILGQPQNIEATIQIYNAAVPAFEASGLAAFDAYSSGRVEGELVGNRFAWINQWLTTAPRELSAAVTESRTDDTSKNSKIATLVDDLNQSLDEFVKSLAPVKPGREPKDPNASKGPRASRAKKARGDAETTGSPLDEETFERDGGSEDSLNTTLETEAEAGVYPEVTYAEAATSAS